MSAAKVSPMPKIAAPESRKVKRGFARLAARRAPATEPIAIVDERSPYLPAPSWKTLTVIVEMKIGKFRPNVPIKNVMRRTTLRSGRLHT